MRPFRSNLYLVKGERLVRYEVNAVMSGFAVRPERSPTKLPIAMFLCTDGSSDCAVAETFVQTPALGGVLPGSLHGPSLRKGQ